MLFKTLNTSEQVGWRINKDVLSLVMWALNNRTDAFSDIWEQTDKQAKASKAREARTIYSMASRFVDKTFYHMYYYDFR
jgi:DNA-directed RNA polymerase